MTKIPEIGLEEKEARQLAEAMRAVAEEYDFRPAPKTMALTNLMTTCALVYGSRVFAYRARVEMERADKKARDNPNVTPFRAGA